MLDSVLNNRYRITAQLGVGAMGEVYRATDMQTGQEIALKVLARHLTFDPDMLERFRREGEALRQLSHPNIVRIVDTFQYGSQQVIALEYVGGGSLQQLIRKGPLPIEQACRIALELCDALTRAHHLKIIHRDIKPENVLLTSDGTPKLTDFGVARLVSEGTRLTGTGTQVGTPFYMSPEAWQGQRLDGQADIWSLGVLIYEMVSGQVPFGGDTLVAVMNKVLTAPLPDLKPLRPDVPPDLVKIVRKMLARDKAKRYQTIREVALDLERVAETSAQTHVKAPPPPRPAAPPPEPAPAETVLAPWLSQAETPPAAAPAEMETVLATRKPKPAGAAPSRGVAIGIAVAVVALMALAGFGGLGWWALNAASRAGQATQEALAAQGRAAQMTPTVAAPRPTSTLPSPTSAPPPTPLPPPAPTAAPVGPRGMVGIVLPSTNEPRWAQDQARFADALKTTGYDVQILFSQNDPAREKANVEKLLGLGMKVLILCPVDSNAAGAAADEAHAAGVKIISYDRLILGTASVDYFVTFDSIAVGKQQGQYLVDHVRGKGNPLYLFAGAAGDNNAFVFFQGAWSVLQPKIADGTFVIKNSAAAVRLQGNATLTRDQEGQIIGSITTNWAADAARQMAASSLLSATPADKGNVFILAPNDGTARAIADVFAADKGVKSYVITGQDAEIPSVQYIIDGKQSMTVFKDLRTLVNDTATAAMAFLNGQTPPSTAPVNNGRIDVPAKPSAVLTVDKSNVKSALIDSGYYQPSDFTGLAGLP